MQGESSNKLVPIIVGVLGVLYGISPVDILPDVVPVFGWIDDLVFTGGSILGVMQGFAQDSNAAFAGILKFFKWTLWLLGGIAVLLIALLGGLVYKLVAS